jgi:hypothetical protein
MVILMTQQRKISTAIVRTFQSLVFLSCILNKKLLTLPLKSEEAVEAILIKCNHFSAVSNN